LEIEDVVAQLVRDGHRFGAIPYRGWRRNINTPEDVARVEDRLGAARES
jgi:dTDP-glucose pyrophosphorylase